MPLPFVGAVGHAGNARKRVVTTPGASQSTGTGATPAPSSDGVFGGGAGSFFEDFKSDYQPYGDSRGVSNTAPSSLDLSRRVSLVYGPSFEHRPNGNSGTGTIFLGGSPPSNGTGVMMQSDPNFSDKSRGYGHGLFEFRCRFTTNSNSNGDGSGPAVILWPGSNNWPGPEIDIGEINWLGNVYFATHWDGRPSGSCSDRGGDCYQSYDVKDASWWNLQQDFYTDWHVYACFLQANRLTYYLDGKQVAVETDSNRITADYAHGGENHTMGVLNRSSGTTLECDWMRWTPEATMLGGGGSGSGGVNRTISIGYTGDLQVGTKQVTLHTTGGVSRVGLTVFSNVAPNYPWYDAETKDNLAVDTNGDVTTTVQIRAVGDKIKAFASTGPAARDFTIQAESAAATAAPGGTTAPVVVGTGNAASLFAKMGLGVNQERFTSTGHAQSRTAAYYSYYRGLGFKHVRFFIPAGFESWQVSLGSNSSAISGWLDAVQACVDSGMPTIHLDGTDVIGDWQLPSANEVNALNGYVQMFAAAVAARNFPVDRVMVGAINEYGAGTNTFWEAHRLRWNGYLRAALPNHTIVEGACNWKDPRSLWDPNTPPWNGAPAPGVFNKWSDTNCIQDCHQYIGWDASGMDWLTGQVRAWSSANNRPAYFGEYGFDSADGDKPTNVSNWITRLDAETQYENVCAVRPCFWAVTDGGAWRMNEIGTNTMVSGLADPVKRWAGRVDTRIANATTSAPAQTTPTTPAPTQGSGSTLNILVRGQSNAYLFCDYGNGYPGGCDIMGAKIAQLTGRTVNVLQRHESNDPCTIYSGTEFLTEWMSGTNAGGHENDILNFVGALGADKKTAPFVEIWMHNESDQKKYPSTADWVAAVRAEATLMRNKLGLTASQHLRYFVPIRYNYGDITNIRAGMDQLAADSSFNARVSMAAWSLRMDNSGVPNTEHMGIQDARDLAANLAAELAALFPAGGTVNTAGPSTSTSTPQTTTTATATTTTKQISFNPNPPTRSGNVWSTTIVTTGFPVGTVIKWAVQNDGNANPPWGFEGNVVNQVTVNSSGQMPINPAFNKAGQFLQAFPADDTSFQRYSVSVYP